jgi:hypothetical protein
MWSSAWGRLQAVKTPVLDIEGRSDRHRCEEKGWVASYPIARSPYKTALAGTF